MSAVRAFFERNLVAVLCGAGFLFSAGGLAWAYFSLRSITGQPLILHFNDMQGITQVGNIGYLVAAGVLGMLVAVINFFLARELEPRDRFLARFLAALTLVFGFLLFIAFVAILKAN